MKKYITVYELIQNLTKFPSDASVEIHMWTTHENIPKHEKEWESDDYVRLDADELDYMHDLRWNDENTAVVLEVDAEVKKWI